MPNQNPEQIARDHIDKQLIACGWIIQGMKQMLEYYDAFEIGLTATPDKRTIGYFD